MKNALLAVLLFSGLATAACPAYQHTDFAWNNTYAQPVRPLDTLLDVCPSIGLPDSQVCIAIQNQTLTPAQQKSLVLDDLTQNNANPPFSEASAWNSQLKFGGYPPDNTTAWNSTNIKNAWVRIAALSPAVINSSDGTEYINDSGVLQAAFNFTFVVPNQTYPQDCRTNYYVCGYNYSFVLQNNGAQTNSANQPQATFTANPADLFFANLTINSEYSIDHYQWVRRCNGRWCNTVCGLVNTEVHKDNLTVTDTKTAYQYASNPGATVFVDAFNNGLVNAWISTRQATGLSRLQLTLGNSVLALQSQQFGLSYDLPPYNVLTPAFTDINRTQTSGLSLLSQANETIHVLAKVQAPDCQLGQDSPFTNNTNESACAYNSTAQPVINLTTDTPVNLTFQANATFYDNSTGAPLVGEVIIFAYGNQTQSNVTDDNGSVSAVFNYSRGTNLVSARFDTDFQTKSAVAVAVIHSPEPWFLVNWGWIVFFMVACIVESKLKGWHA